MRIRRNACKMSALALRFSARSASVGNAIPILGLQMTRPNVPTIKKHVITIQFWMSKDTAMSVRKAKSPTSAKLNASMRMLRR